MDALLTSWGAIPGMERIEIANPTQELAILCGMGHVQLIQFKFYVKDSAGVEREIDFLIDAAVAADIPVPAHVDAWRLRQAADLCAKQLSLPIYLFDQVSGKTLVVHPDYGVRKTAKQIPGGEALAQRLASIPGVGSVELLENPLIPSETLVLCRLPGAKLEELVTHAPDSVIADASAYDGLFNAIAQEIANHV